MTVNGGQFCGTVRGSVMEGAVVVTVVVKDEAAPPLGVRDAGESVQIASEGAPVQVRVTVPLNPLMGVTWRL
jgi:hypothetical protein